MNNKKKNTRMVAAATSEEARHAFERIEPRFKELAAGELVAITVDIARAASIVLGAEAGIRALQPQIEAKLPEFDVGQIESLRDMALAAWYVHAAIAPEVDEGEVKRLVSEATPLKRSMLVQADALADRGLLDAQRIAIIRAGRGSRDLANDMVALSAMFRQSWGEVEGKTAVTIEELDRAAELGTKLIFAIGARDVAPALPGIGGDAGELRVRAFSLLVNTYDQVRRAVEYLRWDAGDAQEIAPSVYTGSRTRRAVAEEVESGPAEGAVPENAGPAVSPVNGAVVAQPVVPAVPPIG
jgi:hypothetical protein